MWKDVAAVLKKNDLGQNTISEVVKAVDKNGKELGYADVAIHDMPEKVSYKAKENREIKNSILVDLFYNDENAEENDIALYNALHEEPLPEGTVIQKMRVENALYLNFMQNVRQYR